jgi:hypothetical protein
MDIKLRVKPDRFLQRRTNPSISSVEEKTHHGNYTETSHGSHEPQRNSSGFRHSLYLFNSKEQKNNVTLDIFDLKQSRDKRSFDNLTESATDTRWLIRSLSENRH